MFGIENGLWEKSIFFSSSFHSYIGKSTIQQNSKRSLSMRLSSSPTLVRAGPANFTNSLRLAGDEEHRVADAEPELIGDLLGALRADVLGERAGAALLALAPEDVAEPRLALALRPGRSCGRRTRGCRRFGAGIAQTSSFGSFASMPAKILKPEPRNASLTFCISIGLRRSGLSVPYLRIASA